MKTETLRHKIVKRNKVGHVKCYLRKHFWNDPDKVVYYTISASDGSFHQVPNEEKAQTCYEQLIAFEKSQQAIKFTE